LFWPTDDRRFAGALLVHEIDEGGFVLVFEPIRLEMTRLLIDDVLGEIEHARVHGERYFPQSHLPKLLGKQSCRRAGRLAA
jgi:hypothetical protein